MNNDKDLATRVAEQRADVENYSRLVDNARGNRWYWIYREELDRRKAKLQDLETQLQELGECERGTDPLVNG